MWDKKIDSRLQSKIPETFFNSLLNGKSDPLGNFSKASLLDRVVCQITQQWILHKLFSKCNIALKWDFFFCIQQVEGIFICLPRLSVTVLWITWSTDSSAKLHAWCLPCRNQTPPRKIWGVSWFFDLCLHYFDHKLPAGCAGCGWPQGDASSSPVGAKQPASARAVMGMGGPSSKENLQTQPSCSRGELSFPDEDSRPWAFLRNSFLRSSAVVVHQFNLQFSCWQELQEHPAPAQLGRMGASRHDHAAEGFWVTMGGQGTAGTRSRCYFGAGPGSKVTHPCTTTQRGFLVARANGSFWRLQRSVATLQHQAQICVLTDTANF